MRDDFSKRTITELAQRVGYRCSNPKCQKPTAGPRARSSKSIIIGVAAHITAASAGGKRYDSHLTPAQRKAANNGIWLCQNCGKLIDNDENRYTVRLLRRWKRDAEELALAEIEVTNGPQSSSRKGHSQINPARERDLGTLRLIFENLYTLALDEFFRSSPTGYRHDMVLYYWEYIDAITSASRFHIYDKILKTKLSNFVNAWRMTFKYGNDFFPTASPWLSKFEVTNKSRKRFEAFAKAVGFTEQTFKQFTEYVKAHYFEIDLKQTDTIALNSYKEHMRSIVEPANRRNPARQRTQ